MSKLVFLSGPITGLSYDTATDWRFITERTLNLLGITAVSPLRYTPHLRSEVSIRDSYPDHVMSSSKGLTTRNRWDVSRCDVLLVNLLDAQRVSIGTVMEIGWADAWGKPIVLVDHTESIHTHAMLRTVAGYLVHSVDEGVEIVKRLLQ